MLVKRTAQEISHAALDLVNCLLRQGKAQEAARYQREATQARAQLEQLEQNSLHSRYRLSLFGRCWSQA